MAETTWIEKVDQSFGEFVPGAYLPHAVYGYFMNGGSRCYVVSARTIPKAQAPLLNSAGKPQLVVKAKKAGFEGLRLRVRIADVALPAPAQKKTAAKGKEEAEGEAPGLPACCLRL